jgi:sulfate transport system ATP-binding protein
VSELLELVQLEDYGDRYPAQLSGGQQQRVAFARALAVRPRVLLLDEPFGALDVLVRHELRSWLHELHAETGVTTLLVTHDQTEALELAEHVVVMFDGRVAQAAGPSTIYDHPANPRVAAFVGGVNVLTGQVKNGRADMGPVAVTTPESAVDGQEVRAFLRPNDVKLAKPQDGAGEVALGRIERMRRVGGVIKVSLALPSGDKMTVEISKAELELLGVDEGDRVLVDLQAAKVFVGDYAI